MTITKITLKLLKITEDIMTTLADFMEVITRGRGWVATLVDDISRLRALIAAGGMSAAEEAEAHAALVALESELASAAAIEPEPEPPVVV